MIKIKSKIIYLNGEKSNYRVYENGDILNEKKLKMKGGLDKNGYNIISLTHKKKKYTRKRHRLVAEAFIENIFNDRDVNHKDGNKLHNSVDNLEWMSPYENTHHALDNGLRSKTVDKKDIKNIVNLLKTGKYSISDISKLTGFSSTYISKIKNKKIWKKETCESSFNNIKSDKIKYGELNGNSKINEKIATKVCKLIKKEKTPTEISKKLNISRKIVYDIKNKLTWKYLSDKYF